MEFTINGEDKIKRFQEVFRYFTANFDAYLDNMITLRFKAEGLTVHMMEARHVVDVKAEFDKELFCEYIEPDEPVAVMVDMDEFAQVIMECTDFLSIEVLPGTLIVLGDSPELLVTVDDEGYLYPKFELPNKAVFTREQILDACESSVNGVVSLPCGSVYIHERYARLIPNMELGDYVIVYFEYEMPVRFVLCDDFVTVDVLIANIIMEG